MKKTLLIALLLISFLGFSQTTKPIDGFLGIKFGSSRTVVLAAVRAKGGEIDKSYNDADALVFDNVNLGHRTADVLIVKFIDNKSFDAEFDFKPEVEAKVISDYDDLVTDLTEVYGKGQDTKNYTLPYKEGDGETLLGLSAGKIDFNTLWLADNKNALEVSISTDMQVELTYQDSKLFDEAVARQKSKDKADY